jgi:hypothetical protein
MVDGDARQLDEPTEVLNDRLTPDGHIAATLPIGRRCRNYRLRPWGKPTLTSKAMHLLLV